MGCDLEMRRSSLLTIHAKTGKFGANILKSHRNFTLVKDWSSILSFIGLFKLSKEYRYDKRQ